MKKNTAKEPCPNGCIDGMVSYSGPCPLCSERNFIVVDSELWHALMRLSGYVRANIENRSRPAQRLVELSADVTQLIEHTK
jgi:hypothetical protein